jgi:hypothetical protein
MLGYQKTESLLCYILFLPTQLTYFTVKVGAAGFLKMFVSIYKTTRCHIPDDRNLSIHCCERGHAVA